MNIVEVLNALLLGFPPSPEMVDPRFPAAFQRVGGLALSVAITVLSLVAGAPIGVVLALAQRAPKTNRYRFLLKSVVAAVVRGIQGLPIMLLVLLIFYLPYPLIGWRLPPVVLALTAFTLYNAVYLSGIILSGLAAVEQRWIDAARTLGLSRRQVFWNIQLPIAWRAMLPALLGQAITVFKDTSVLAVVAVGELTYSARQLQSAEPVNYSLVLLLVLILYWTVAASGSAIVSKLDHSPWREAR